MTKTPSSLSETVLKNIETQDANTGMAVANLIMAQVNADRRRLHLAGGVQSVQWDRQRGIGLLMNDAGQMIHLANLLSLTATMVPRAIDGGRRGVGRGRTGTFAGHTVTVWYVEV